MDSTVFYLLERPITVFQIVLCSISFLILGWVYRKLLLMINAKLIEEKNLENSVANRLNKMIFIFLSLVFLLICISITGINPILSVINGYELNVRLLVEGGLIFVLANISDWFMSHVFVKQYFVNRNNSITPKPINEQKVNNENATSLVQWIVYLYFLSIMLNRLNLDFVLFHKDIKNEIFTVHIGDIIMAVLIILVAKLAVWFLTQVTLFRLYKKESTDEGTQFAINQLIKYVIYTISIILAMKRIISDMSIIYGGAAALMVGVGLGLQATFNDFFSGLVLLFERSVRVGDVLELDNSQVGKVLKIGLRATRVETRNSVSMLIPNSKLVNQAVTNWTHFDEIVRFQVDVGVAYGSDSDLVSKLLLQACQSNTRILDEPKAFVRFQDFGDSSLGFSIYFFTKQVMGAEDVKSDLRFEIDKLFRSNNISIPFPQRDIWVRKMP